MASEGGGAPPPRFGALVGTGGTTRFRVWSPEAATVELRLDGDDRVRPLARSTGDALAGVFETAAPAPAGTRYRLRRDGGEWLPDPASRHQPEGVHGPSEVVDPSRYRWRDTGWRGVRQRDLVFYELHVGTFTSEGTFAGVRERLGELAALGVTALELMPLADFPGRWGWGYDPAALYAPSRAYGTPDELRALVDAAHAAGLAVFLDVIYNHLGPDGAYLAAFAPAFTGRHETPWGLAMNLDDRHGEGLRAFFVDNALHWLREYHLDGLRLDATHALVDERPGEPHFLAELAAAVAALPGRRLLVAEDERNERRLVVPRQEGGLGLDAVWADDFHHQVRNATAGDRDAYFRDFADTTAADLAATLRQGWFYTGQRAVTTGLPRGTDPAGLAPERFVVAIQNHDQVGNRPDGARLHHEIPGHLYRAVSALLLAAPQLPLLFMGQEWATTSPFLYFTDHEPELGRQVSEGRRRELGDFPGFAGEVPDPQDPATFERSRLDWSERDAPPHRGVLRLYRDLLHLRREMAGDVEVAPHGDRGLVLRRGRHTLLLALAPGVELPLPAGAAPVLHTEDPAYTDDGRPPQPTGDALRFPVAAAAVYRGQ